MGENKVEDGSGAAVSERRILAFLRCGGCFFHELGECKKRSRGNSRSDDGLGTAFCRGRGAGGKDAPMSEVGAERLRLTGAGAGCTGGWRLSSAPIVVIVRGS